MKTVKKKWDLAKKFAIVEQIATKHISERKNMRRIKNDLKKSVESTQVDLPGKHRLLTIPISTIVDPKLGDRKIDSPEIPFLTDSIKEIGQLTPITVKSNEKSDGYILHDGSNRLLAAKHNGDKAIKAMVFDHDVEDAHIRRCVLEGEFNTKNESWAIKCVKLNELKLIYENCYPITKRGKWDRSRKWGKQKIPAFVTHMSNSSCKGRSKIRPGAGAILGQ